MPRLGKPLLRILAALYSGDSLTRRKIGELTGIQVSSLCEYLGSPDPVARAKGDIRGKVKSLLTLELVDYEHFCVPEDDIDEIVYTINDKGVKALLTQLKDNPRDLLMLQERHPELCEDIVTAL